MSDSLGSNEKPGSLPTSQGILKPPRLVLENTETTSQTSGAMQNGEPENKKAHLDDDKDDDTTSTYDVSDDEDMGDDAPFTVVTCKKKRAEGIPVVFRPTEEGTSFWQVNPNRVSTEIVSAAKEKVQSFRTTRDGSFSVSVASLASAKRLLMLTNVGGLEVKPFIPESYTRNVGKAAPRTRLLRNCVDMNLSMEDSRDAMKPHQILTSFIRRKDSNIRGHRNHKSQENHHETHQGNQQEYSQEHNQEDLSQSSRLMRRRFKYPRDNRQKKRHVSPSDPTCSIQKQHQLMATTLLHQ
ncbi:hypothetical protein HPB50_022414 [Hyalomma asiaticum]|uniref:Uncharacterized protein n=1 Tax=Hyalomma asiaticum TaxID=266040 RepID=A0ACB7TBL2_HYAAI|nr:hypothetical protein HPB50_022414 [Hyalomma asiaticum]